MRKLVLAVAVLSVTVLAVGSVAAADPPGGPRCTMGEAKSNFQALLPHFVSDDPSVQLKCQYRLFFDGGSFTYCEDDVILGGSNVFATYQELEELGWTRKEGIAFLERIGDRVWIDGVERQLMHTAYKNGQHPILGLMVVQQRAFITKFPVGDHVSYWESSFDGVVDFTATVQLHILPRTDALCS